MEIPLKESQIRKAEHIFSCKRSDDLSTIKEIYRVLSKKYHSDKIGTNTMIYDVNEAYTTLKKYKDRHPSDVVNDCLNTGFYARDCHTERDEILDDLNDFIEKDLGIRRENVDKANEGLKVAVRKFFDIFNDETVSPFLNQFLFQNKNTKQKKSAKDILYNIFDESKEKLNAEGQATVLKYVNTVFGWNFKVEDFEKVKAKRAKSKAKTKPIPNTTTTKAESLKYKIAITSNQNLNDLLLKKKGSYFCFVESESTGIQIHKLLNLFFIDKKLENNRAILICRDKNNIIYRVSTG